MKIINEQSIIGIEELCFEPNWNYSLGDTYSRNTWIAICRNTKWGGVLINHKGTVSYRRIFTKKHNCSWQKLRVFVKQGLAGVWNYCIATRLTWDHKSYGWQLLIDIVLKMAGSVLKSDIAQKIHRFSEMQNMSETTLTMAVHLHFECLKQVTPFCFVNTFF